MYLVFTAAGSVTVLELSTYEHAYNASKAGARMLADGLRAELCQRSVTVTGIYPGFIATEMIEGNAFEIGAAMPIAEAANIIVDGLKHGRDEILFPEELAQKVAQVVNLPVGGRITAVRALMDENSRNL